VDACPDGIYQVPCDCGSFYHCTHGNALEPMACPAGLHFNEAAQYCDWPENVTCKTCDDDQSPEAIPTTTAPETPNSDYCPDGHYQVDCDCGSFYQCDHGKPTEVIKCPDDLLFNESTERCDWPHNVTCKSCDQAPEVIPTTVAPEEVPETPDSNYCPDGHYQVDCDCGSFYQCSHGKPTEVIKCPDDLLFNESTERCDWPHNVTCKPCDQAPEVTPTTAVPETAAPESVVPETGAPETAAPDTEAPETEAPETPDSDYCPDGHYQVDCNCGSFYQCVHGKPTEVIECPDGLLFNESIERCDWSQNVTCKPCDQVPEVIPTTVAPETVPETPNSDYCADGHYQVDCDCGSFYQCAHGKPTEIIECPDGLLFNESTERCDWPPNVTCKPCDQAPEQIPTTASPEVELETPNSDYCDDGYYQVNCDCTSFYQCVNGSPTESITCPEGLLFDVAKTYCDWPHTVQCQPCNH